MTDNIVPLGRGRGSFIASVELYRSADGRIEAVLADMPGHIIEGEQMISARFFELAERMIEGALSFMRQGCAFDLETRESKNDNERGAS